MPKPSQPKRAPKKSLSERGSAITAALELGLVGAPPSSPEEISRAIYEVVAAIPRGTVATYGQVAELAGLPRGHRRVARAMRYCPKGLPWQRVVGRKDARRAQIAIQDAEHAARQRALLRAERVRFDEDGFIVLKQFGWTEGLS
jgi:methylated-DNA-protein-cysteine methyltransferase related protein